MNYNFDQQLKTIAPVRKLLAAALVLGCAFGTASMASAQTVTPPPTPTLIAPPVGATPFLLGRALGTQGYICLPSGAGASWAVNPARPEATLFTSFFGLDIQIITHFLSPNTKPNKFAPSPLPVGNATWQSSLDSSNLWTQVAHA